MAKIERHPGVEDYIHELTLADIAARNGIADIFEEGQMIILKDFRLNFDFAALASLNKSIDEVEDVRLRKTLKKMKGTSFFEGEPPVVKSDRLLFADPVRQAIFDVICRGDRALFEQASSELKKAHEDVLRIFAICFPEYEPFRFIPSVRLTQTLFENLHWDNHSIDDDFHQARIFANLDSRPRIWHTSHRFPEMVRRLYREHRLEQFAGQDPNLMLDYVNGDVLGGTRNIWMENLPKHRIAFDPGEVWLGESRLISHQIYYGESAMVYMWFIRASGMANDANRFNQRMAALHDSFATVAEPG